MNITSLREGESAQAKATGMIQVEALSLGSDAAVKLVLTGTDIQTNAMSSSALKLTWLRGLAEITLQPVGHDVFPPGTHVQVVLSQGRPNTPAYVAWELPTVTLDGRAELTIGRLNQEGETLTITSVAAKFDARLGKPAETIRAAFRSRLNGMSVPENMEFTVLLDVSASMSVPATERYLGTAADVIKGMADEIAPSRDIELLVAGAAPQQIPQHQIAEVIQEQVQAGKQRVGGSETIPVRPGHYVVVVSDQAPAWVTSGQVTALALVLGDDAAAGNRTVPVNGTLAGALAAGQTDAVVDSVSEMVEVMSAMGGSK